MKVLRVAGCAGLLALAAAWTFRGYFGPAPPVPDDLDRLDPHLAALIEDGTSAVSGHRRRPAAWMRLGMIYEANGLFRYALPCYRRAIDLHGEDARAWRHLAATQERIGDLDVAIGALRRAIALDEGFAPAHRQLGSWLLDVGAVDEAEAALRRAVALDPSPPPAWFTLARMRLQRGENEAAIALIEDHHLVDGPNGHYAWQLLGTARRQMGRLDEAQEAMARGGTAPPEFAAVGSEDLLPFRTGLAALRGDIDRLYTAGQLDRAAPLLEALVRQDPTDTAALNALATLALKHGDVEGAMGRLRAALKVDADDFETNVSVARALLRLRTKRGVDLGIALRHIDRALKVRPVSTGARRLRAEILVALQRPEEAIETLEDAYARDARDPGLLVPAGRLKLLLHRREEAAATFRRVLARRPGDPGASFGLAEALIELGRFDEAGPVLAAARPTSPGEQQRLTVLLRRLKK